MGGGGGVGGFGLFRWEGIWNGSARRGYLFQVSGINYERVGISVVEACEGAGKSVILVCKRTQIWLKDAFYG